MSSKRNQPETETDQVESEDNDEQGNETDETQEESVRLALQDLQEGNGESDGNQSETVEESSPENDGVAQEQVAEPEKQSIDEIDPDDYKAPSRLTAREKKLFNKMPKEVRPAVARMFKEHQSNESRRQAEHSRVQKDSERMVEAVRPYYAKNTIFAEHGVTESGFVAMLVAGHQNMTSDEVMANGEKKDWVALELAAKSRGYRIARVDETGKVVDGTSSGKVVDPEVLRLRNEVHSLKTESNSARDHRDNQAAASISSEWREIQAQNGPDGNAAYPELRTETFWKKASPFAINLIATEGIPAKEALRRAYVVITGKDFRQIQSQAKPASNNSNNTNRAITANGSVRGNTSNAILSSQSHRAVGANESAEDSVRIALEELQRGIG